jgi:ABC-2 type transport system ATP-binding protein
VADALRAATWVLEVTDVGYGRLRVAVASVEDAERGITRVLADTGARVISVEPETADLEQVFLELTSGAIR